VKMDTVAGCPTDVEKDPFDECPMGVCRGMHMKAYLMHYISDVRLSQRKVLEHACNVVVERGIAGQGPVAQ
jgi:hypothetical protein